MGLWEIARALEYRVSGRRPAKPIASRTAELLVAYDGLYKELPEVVNSRPILLTHIETSIERLLDDEAQKRRDHQGIGIGLGFIALASLFSYAAITADSWAWVMWISAAALWPFGLVGLGISIRRVERDERGRPLKQRNRNQHPPGQ